MNNFSKEILSRLKGLRKNQPISIAHRGASAWANENTLRAFRIANKLCSQMWELDVQLTKDKICFCFTDCTPHESAAEQLKSRLGPPREKKQGILH